jgi:hypothetical protein
MANWIANLREQLEDAAFAAKHRDYKNVRADGTRSMLYFNPATGGTESWPVSAIPSEDLLRCLHPADRGPYLTLAALQTRETR